MQHYDQHGKKYDFCFPDQTRSPKECPYSFDAYFIWKTAAHKGANVNYSDRMYQADYDKATKAFSAVQKGNRAQSLTMREARAVIDIYYDGKYDCVAYGLSCNQSTGYEIGIFWLREKKVQS